MAARGSKRLVIDASVARAAGGEDAVFPGSKYCRDFLKATLVICHHVVMTPEISGEWKRHRSAFARGWLVSMVARKKIYHIENVVNDDMRSRIEHATEQAQEYKREAMRKGLLLIEAAIATDRVIISLDETVRELFAKATQRVGELRNIVWVNPARTEEQPIRWLENRARPEKKRLLGFQVGGRR